MAKATAALVNWYGPYTYETAIEAAKNDYTEGLYLAYGREAHQKKDWIQYVGVSQNLYDRLKKPHQMYTQLTQKCEIWLGEIDSYKPSSRKRSNHSNILELTEDALIYFLQPGLNWSKYVNPPTTPITVFNRWWQTDYVTPYKKKPIKDWQDIIEFWGRDEGARIITLRRTRGTIELRNPDTF
ncbi:hypothetical protein K8I28_02335 [bacterium]|nr:hypothetical protein [bacterium]